MLEPNFEEADGLGKSLINLLFPFLIISSDWGHAKDFVEAMWHMLQLEKPEDFVIATGHMHSVREFVEKSFAFIGKEIVWEGKGKLSAVKCFYLKSTQYWKISPNALRFTYQIDLKIT